MKGCLIAGVIGFLLSVGLVLGLRKIGSLVESSSPDAPALKQEEPSVAAKPERGRALKGVAQMQFTEQVEASKKQAVAKYPELGVRDTAVNREFVRRCKLLQSADPSFLKVQTGLNVSRTSWRATSHSIRSAIRSKSSLSDARPFGSGGAI